MNPRELRVISQDEYKAWFEQHLAALHRRSPFHHPAWLDTVRRGLHFDLVITGAYEGDELVAAIPGFLTRRGPFRLYGSPLRGTMTAYLGPVCLTPMESTDLLGLVKSCSDFARRQWRADYTEITLREPPAHCPQEPGAGWQIERPDSYCIDVSRGVDALWAGMRTRARRCIRKAERLGAHVVPMTDARLFCEILNESFARHGTISRHPKDFFQIIFEELVRQDMVWVWGVEYEGRIISTIIWLHDDCEAHGMSGGALSEFLHVPASSLHYWQALRQAALSGLRVVDLGGRGIPSIDFYKESFNPRVIEFWSLNQAPAYVRYAKRVFLFSVPYLRRLKRQFKAA